METDEEDVFIPKVGYAEALQALQKVRLFEEQHENVDSEWISPRTSHASSRGSKIKAG